jgi:hypothetical protein
VQGPLGVLGPIGTNLWNPSLWMKAVGDWTSWSRQIAHSTNAPLGPSGPLAHYKDLPALNDFGKHLQAQGLWTSLGPLGPLGPLGVLGPVRSPPRSCLSSLTLSSMVVVVSCVAGSWVRWACTALAWTVAAIT